MSNVVFAWDNILQRSGVTFTENGFTEASGYPLENLANPHPALFARITAVTGGPFITIGSLPRTQSHIVAPLYVTASSHRNMFSESNNLAGSDWAANDCTVTDVRSSIALVNGIPVRGWFLLAGAGSVTPYILQTYTKPDVAQELTLSCYVDISVADFGANLYLEMLEGASSAFAKVDLSDGSINSTGVSGSFTGQSATTTLVSGTTHRVTLTVTTTAVATVSGYFRLVDAAYATTYTGASEKIVIGGAQMELSSAATGFVQSDGNHGRAALWAWSESGISRDIGYLATAPDHAAWFDTHGWIHGNYYYSNPAPGQAVEETTKHVYFFDPHNPNAQIDLSLFIGPAWQVAQNLPLGGATWLTPDPETGGRRLRTSFTQQTKAEIFGQLQPMLNRCRVGRPRETRITNGGQEYRPGHLPVLVTINPDEDPYLQENTLYGFIDTAVYPMMDTHPGLYDMSLTFTEVLP